MMRGYLLRMAVGGAIFLAVLALCYALVFVPFLVIGGLGLLSAYGIGDIIVSSLSKTHEPEARPAYPPGPDDDWDPRVPGI